MTKKNSKKDKKRHVRSGEKQHHWTGQPAADELRRTYVDNWPSLAPYLTLTDLRASLGRSTQNTTSLID